MSIDTQEIVRLEKEADELDISASDKRYEAAYLIAAALAEGKSQDTLAVEISKSQKHVSLMKAVALQYPGSEDRPSFNKAYQAAKQPRDKKPKSDTPMTGAEDKPVAEVPAPGNQLALPDGADPEYAAVVLESAAAHEWTADQALAVAAMLTDAANKLGEYAGRLRGREVA